MLHTRHQEITKAVIDRQADFLSGLKEVMRINSVKDAPHPEAPFGHGPKDAVLKALALAEQLGFETKFVNDAMGYAQWGSDNDHYVGVVGHLDVVPEGTGWDVDPFDLTEKDGILYGRGILDNKGPIMSNLYALAVLKDLGLQPKETIRIIFGSDEESGSADIPMYLAKEKPPMYGYTPDCKYPAVYGERGVVGFDIVTSLTDDSLDQLTSFKGNFDRSSVPDTLTVNLADGSEIAVQGKRAPSNAPDMGSNVITLFGDKVLSDNLLTGQLHDYFVWIATRFHNQHQGEGLGADFSDEDSGSLQLTPYDLSFKKQTAILSVSIRYPISVTEDEVIQAISNHLFPHSEINVTRRMPSTVFDRHHPMIDTMTEVYEYVTDFDGAPVTTTGATYARTMPNIIAFGPSFPGQKGIAHNKNEYMTVADLMTNMTIYAQTLAALVCED